MNDKHFGVTADLDQWAAIFFLFPPRVVANPGQWCGQKLYTMVLTLEMKSAANERQVFRISADRDQWAADNVFIPPER